MSVATFAVGETFALMHHSAPAPVAADGARRCGCGVVLSVYNEGSVCFQCAHHAAIEQRISTLPAVRVTLPEVGPLLKAWRAEHRATQADLAQLLGFDSSFISLVERGKRHIRDIEHLARISARLGFPPERLGVAAAVIHTDPAPVAA